jgi:hypothetical protein
MRRVLKSSTAPYNRDHCRLCGNTDTDRLSKTHVPPRGAGNRNAATRVVETVDEHQAVWIEHDTPRDGGAYGYWFCRDCNGTTGRWDEAYISWVRQLAGRLAPNRRARTVAFDLVGWPGAIARAMWAWMFALDPNLPRDHPLLVNAILSGDPVSPPANLKLLLAATTDLSIWVSGQPGAIAFRGDLARPNLYQNQSGILLPGLEMEDCPRSVVSSPPFVAILANAGDDTAGVDYFNASAWLEDDARVERRVCLLLPIISVSHAAKSRTPMTYEELARGGEAASKIDAWGRAPAMRS